MSESEKKSDAEPDASKSTRRDALDVALTATGVVLGGTAAYPIVRYLSAEGRQDKGELRVKVGKPEDVGPGEAVAFRFGNKPGLLVRDLQGKLRAFLAVCTHLDCIVQFKHEEEVIWCACHNGTYDLTGRNIKGPPPRPLTALAVEIDGGEVIVMRGSA